MSVGITDPDLALEELSSRVVAVGVEYEQLVNTMMS
jgi:hypothetical protein